MNYQEKAIELRSITGKTPGEEFVNESHIALAIFLIEAQIDPEEEIDPLWIIGHIFQAGKIEGIRKERAKRKRKNNKDYKGSNGTTLKSMGVN